MCTSLSLCMTFYRGKYNFLNPGEAYIIFYQLMSYDEMIIHIKFQRDLTTSYKEC